MEGSTVISTRRCLNPRVYYCDKFIRCEGCGCSGLICRSERTRDGNGESTYTLDKHLEFRKLLDNHAGFSDLPGEIRNTIYKLSLTSATTMDVDIRDNTRFNRGGSPNYGISPQLLRVCKRLHHETQSLLVSENTIRIQLDHLTTSRHERVHSQRQSMLGSSPTYLVTTPVSHIFSSIRKIVLSMVNERVHFLQNSNVPAFLSKVDNLQSLTVELDDPTLILDVPRVLQGISNVEDVVVRHVGMMAENERMRNWRRLRWSSPPPVPFCTCDKGPFAIQPVLDESKTFSTRLGLEKLSKLVKEPGWKYLQRMAWAERKVNRMPTYDVNRVVWALSRHRFRDR